ncbi:FixH family protein [Ramlibacter sp. AN1133]|uniref:FixH family protein n=1 Tax=Ramlibacter sp. AN1133 TaxID=3133429 RepID=UPI0030C478E4
MNPIPMQGAQRRRRLFLVSLALLAAGCSAGARIRPPQDAADYATERLSAQGAFRVAYRTEGPVPVGRLHAWTLHVARANGTPVTDAVFAVDGDMPQHGHGLPTRPRVTRHLGNGDYLLEGVKFQMGGWWVMDFDVTADGRTERVRFHLQLNK